MRPASIYFCFLFFCAGIAKCFAQDNCPPPNIGFEDGNFQYWQCATGFVNANGQVSVSGTAPVTNRHIIIDKYSEKFDRYGKFPTLCPNGSNYSIKVGNDSGGAEAEQVSYTFKIPPSQNNYSLFFNYAVVLQNPDHLPFQQPRFTVKVYNVDDNIYIDCSSFDFVPGQDLKGFRGSAIPYVVYKDWSTANINLQGYAGKTIRMEFTTNDCTLGAHFGYAYLDFNQNCTLPITGNTYCSGQTAITLTGPDGFDQYEWHDAANKKVGDKQTIKISPPPPDNTPYSLILTPSNGLGCVATLQTVVNKIDAGFKFLVKDTLFACPNTTVDITDATVTAGSSDNLKFTYSLDENGSSFIYQPDKINTTGTYYIKAVNPSGCTNTLPVFVNFLDSLGVKVTNPKPVTYPGTVDISKTFDHSKGFTYTYYKDAATKDSVNQNIGVSGTYFIKATSSIGCSVVTPVQLIISAPPPAMITAPNVFTPNNDGINDYFYLTIAGYNQFEHLKIYNRNGNEVFETKTIDGKWDGTYNGQLISTGVYYWVYEGKSSYDQSKIIKSGYVTIIR